MIYSNEITCLPSNATDQCIDIQWYIAELGIEDTQTRGSSAVYN